MQSFAVQVNSNNWTESAALVAATYASADSAVAPEVAGENQHPKWVDDASGKTRYRAQVTVPYQSHLAVWAADRLLVSVGDRMEHTLRGTLTPESLGFDKNSSERDYIPGKLEALHWETPCTTWSV